MSAVSKWMSQASRTRWSRGARAFARAPPGGRFCAKCDQYMVFFDDLRLSIRDSRDQRPGGVTDRCLGPCHHVAHVFTWGSPWRKYFALK